jgi:adenylosuccinate synthase
MTKADILDTFDSISVAVAYKVRGKEVDHIPFEIDEPVEPVYKEFKGWKTDISKCKSYEELPAELKSYIKFIEDETGVPVKIVSVGPDREATIVRTF